MSGRVFTQLSILLPMMMTMDPSHSHTLLPWAASVVLRGRLVAMARKRWMKGEMSFILEVFFLLMEWTVEARGRDDVGRTENRL